MRRAWLAELWIIAGLFAAAAAAGYYAGGLLWWLAGAGALYAALNVRSAARQLKWLGSGLDGPPPDAFGLWAEVSHRLYQERREGARGGPRGGRAGRGVRAFGAGVAGRDRDPRRGTAHSVVECRRTTADRAP